MQKFLIWILFVALNMGFVNVVRSDWKQELTDDDQRGAFSNWLNGTRSQVEKQAFTFYLMIHKIRGNAAAVPLQCTNTNDRIAEMTITLARSDHRDKMTAALNAAYAHVNLPPNSRAVADFQLARQQMETAGVAMPSLVDDLIAVQGALDTQVQGLFNIYKPAVVAQIGAATNAVKVLLEGTIENKEFLYYKELVVGKRRFSHMLVMNDQDNRVNLVRYSDNRDAGIVVQITKKSKEFSSKDKKYVKYSGNVAPDALLKALKNTAWKTAETMTVSNLQKKG